MTPCFPLNLVPKGGRVIIQGWGAGVQWKTSPFMTGLPMVVISAQIRTLIVVTLVLVKILMVEILVPVITVVGPGKTDRGDTMDPMVREAEETSEGATESLEEGEGECITLGKRTHGEETKTKE